MIYHEIEPYLEAKERYTNTPFRIIDGVGYCFVRGEWVTESEYDEHNSKPYYSVAAKINPDGTTISGGTIPTKSRR